MPAPDVFVVSKPDYDRACAEDAWLTILPVLVVEVNSPSNTNTRVEEKVAYYLASGVKEVWLIEPKQQTLERLRCINQHFQISERP